jgi:hypothetical protein
MPKIAAFFCLVLASCALQAGARNVCAESRNIRCLTEVVCTPTSRGCDSCECAAAGEPARAGEGDKR